MIKCLQIMTTKYYELMYAVKIAPS